VTPASVAAPSGSSRTWLYVGGGVALVGLLVVGKKKGWF
jgi:hypothetical protein